MSAKVATVLLTHQFPDQVGRMLDYWRGKDALQQFVVAYGGSRENFERLEIEDKVFVEDRALRTKHHPRERQSYLGILQAVVPWLADSDATHVHLAEFDEIPLVTDLNRRLLAHMEQDRADVLGHRCQRVDGTSHPHFLSHAADPWFGEFWQGISLREEKEVVLSMLGCGTFWKRCAFEDVARLSPPSRIYLELFLPTAAHHLGYRVRAHADADRFISPEVLKYREEFPHWLEEGAWRAHPVKGMW